MSFYTAVRRRLGRVKRFLLIRRMCSKVESKDLLHFQCNICSRHVVYPKKSLSREGSSCYYCGSTVRLRSVIHALSMELFQQSLPLENFPHRPEISGIGLSDWDGYAMRLCKKLSYTNTYYHQEPFLDITAADAPSFGKYDFILNSDVFEHVAQPVSRGFVNARRLLKPGGVMIFTVPYRKGETHEHYPELAHYTLKREAGGYVLCNETPDGRQQRFPNPTFHGGPGTVVEMRLFGEDSLHREFAGAGFEPPTIYAEEQAKFGIVWNPYIPEDAPYRPLIHGLDTPPWAARVPAETTVPS